MLTTKLKSASGKKASYYFENGFHCAEAVAAAILETFNKNPAQALAHATAFGAGMGRTFDEACGAFSGGLIAIGHLYGRKKPGENWDIPANLSAELRCRFIDIYHTTHCKTLRDKFGKKYQSQECNRLVCKITIELLGLLEKCSDKSKIQG